ISAPPVLNAPQESALSPVPTRYRLSNTFSPSRNGHIGYYHHFRSRPFQTGSAAVHAGRSRLPCRAHPQVLPPKTQLLLLPPTAIDGTASVPKSTHKHVHPTLYTGRHALTSLAGRPLPLYRSQRRLSQNQRHNPRAVNKHSRYKTPSDEAIYRHDVLQLAYMTHRY